MNPVQVQTAMQQPLLRAWYLTVHKTFLHILCRNGHFSTNRELGRDEEFSVRTQLFQRQCEAWKLYRFSSVLHSFLNTLMQEFQQQSTFLERDHCYNRIFSPLLGPIEFSFYMGVLKGREHP